MDILAPLLSCVYNKSLERGSLPPTLTQASVPLLLKKGKNPTSCDTYRPLSLLNVDIKILANVLAIRLEKVLPVIISEKQNGFIIGQQLFFNVRPLLNVIFCGHSSSTPEVVILIEAEKVFDYLDITFLKYFTSLALGTGSWFLDSTSIYFPPGQRSHK